MEPFWCESRGKHRTHPGRGESGKHIVEVIDEAAALKGYIIAVPHVYPQNFPMLDTETPREERQARFFQALLDEVGK